MPAGEHLVGREEDPLLGPLRQDEVSPGLAGPLDEVVLEHQRRDGTLLRGAARTDDRAEVAGLLDHGHGRPDLALPRTG